MKLYAEFVSANCTHSLKVKVEDREYTVSTDPAEWSAVERYKFR